MPHGVLRKMQCLICSFVPSNSVEALREPSYNGIGLYSPHTVNFARRLLLVSSTSRQLELVMAEISWIE